LALQNKFDKYKSMNKLDNFSQKLHHASNASQIKDANSTRASKYTLVNMTDFDQAYRMTTKKNLNSTAIHDISGYVTKSKRNIVENSKKVKNSSNSILQDLHNEEDDLCLSDDLIYAHAEKRPSTNACFKVDFNHPEEKDNINRLSKCRSYHEKPQDKNDLSVSTCQQEKKRKRYGTSPEANLESKRGNKNTYTSQVSPFRLKIG
jgi:hypothetical protein